MNTVSTPMLPIERGCKDLADLRDELASTMTMVNAAIEAVVSKHRRRIIYCTGCASGKTTALYDLVKENHHLFESPKSVILHGIKVGYRKGKGKLVIEDEEETVRLIRKHFPKDKANSLLHITTTPNKEAIEKLSVDELKKIGADVESSGNIPFVKPVDTAVDKLVKALLKGAADEAAIEQEAA